MSARIGFGIATFPFSGPRSFWRWVEMLEDGGVDSLWQTDRLISSQPILEPMATMAALAGGTDRLKFGMNVVVLPFRDPLVIAKQCATIDVLSNGRLLPAFGVGRDVAPEWRASGKDPARRKHSDQTREYGFVGPDPIQGRVGIDKAGRVRGSETSDVPLHPRNG